MTMPRHATALKTVRLLFATFRMVTSFWFPLRTTTYQNSSENE
jgi:hypothetical protein